MLTHATDEVTDDSVELPVDGTHEITVRPDAVTTGTLSLRLASR